MALIVTTTITNVDTWNLWLPASLLFPPLTTLFEPPTDCSTEWLQNPLATNNVKSGFHDFCVTGLSGTVDCVMDYDTFIPTDYFGRCRPDKHAMTLGYSPGICTSGQTVAAIIERQYKSSTYWMGRCCDRDMAMSTVDGNCIKTFSTPMRVLANFTTTWTRGSMTVTASAFDLTTYACTGTGDESDCADTTLRRFTDVTSGTAWAAPLVVYWESKDLSHFPPDYAMSLASVIKVPFGDISSSLSNSTVPPLTPPPTNPNDQGSKLSPGAIAGIAVGIVTLVISSVVLGLYLWRRQKQQRLQHPDEAEMEGSSRGLKHFLGGRWRAEQDGTSQLVEAGSSSVKIIPGPPVELDSTPAERTQ